MKHTLKFILSYLGTRYKGWQKTPDHPSIEQSLQGALEPLLKYTPTLQAASRTDAGVHAEGQVVSCLAQSIPQLHSINALLPPDIRVLSLQEVSQDFHPTVDALDKTYTYQICNTTFQLPFYRHLSWHVPMSLDLIGVQAAASHLLGTHDFSAFCNDRALWTRSVQCTLKEIQIQNKEGRLLLTFIGDRFLYRMARNLAGTLVAVGLKRLPPDKIPELLAHKDRTRMGMTAPAHGLCLKQITYL